MIQEALNDLVRFRFARGRRGQRLFWQAHDWVASGDREWFLSLVNLCEAFGLAVEPIRQWAPCSEVETLKRGHLGGVALDAYEREAGVFYSDDSEHGLSDDVLARLLTFPRVIVTSHMGYLTWEALGEIAATTLASLAEFEHGSALTYELRPAAQ